MAEIAKRLQPKGETLRELFLKSGNLCAFPNCTQLMMNTKGEFIGQLCHIEAAEPGGERFNADMSNEQRRAFENLMLMCYEHHVVTNNVQKYTVAKLRKIKLDHERRFSDPSRAILEHLTDWTTTEKPVGAANLGRINELMKWGLNAGQLQESVDELNAYLERFRRVPIDVRRFVGTVALRMHRMRDSNTTRNDIHGTVILASDVEKAHKLSQRKVRDFLAQLESYGLGELDRMSSSLGDEPAIQIRALASGWDLWPDIAAFCENNGTSMQTFTEDLDFSPLDA